MQHRPVPALAGVPPICLLLLFLQAPCGLSGQTLEERITSILSRMTMEEKIKQLHQDGDFRTATNSRLGIPGFVMADGPHGVREGLATSFPVGIGMASTWDTELAERVGVAMGKEFRGKLGLDLELGEGHQSGV